MTAQFYSLSIRTHQRNEFIDVTHEVVSYVKKSGIKNGFVVLYVPHTTAAVTINENADPSVKADILETLSRLVPYGAGYKHLEGNADSHIKSTIVGPSQTLLVKDGELVLGTWQGIFFCEFDGPRTRRMYIEVIGE